ncbi:hypothetical protein FA10DRAFT_264057 [Acaromyces ingoldii]|uniref:Mitochondrial distribution and morphology protein family 31/32 n=1 Tax=Acaromyces ingoldii TaxID=215250 RepID=A0A316YXC9_9BASI|nr:hypothetical protein FA10DRAFT_264057 [Acaromyces ingoldii]PWN93404.1 hypothetical protein FA10DRAFT_264057 [Acaromyces ingoldii]
MVAASGRTLLRQHKPFAECSSHAVRRYEPPRRFQGSYGGAALTTAVGRSYRQSAPGSQGDERYLIIRSFFSGIADGIKRNERVPKYVSLRSRGFSSSSLRASDGKPPPPPPGPRDADQQKGQKIEQPDHRYTAPFHNYPRTLRELAMRARSEVQQNEQGSSSEGPPVDPAHNPSEHDKHDTTGPSSPTSTSSTSRWTRPRPPSKEDLLRITQGFWTRMRIRFKWFTIRGFRRFNADDISAFFTLGGLGTILWIAIGTTTFVSVVFAALNALNMQEWIARKIADYLTSETGVTVIFESAIVPKWKDSRICFQNVFISRRAYGHDVETLREERLALRRGSRQERRRRMTAFTAGQGMAWEGTDIEDRYGIQHDDSEVAPPMSDRARGEELVESEVLDVRNNYTMFDLNVDSIDVKLSFSRWFDGKGLIEDAVVQGVRGIIDRRNVFWDPEKPYDPRAARRQAKHGDFELASLMVSDFLVTVYQPGDFRPFNLSVFEAAVPRLRKQWLFYDLLSADRITGQIDGCLFSLHKPQSIGRTTGREREIMSGRWKTLSRLRVDGVNFDHIQNQSDLHGPVSWILSGKFDVVADIKFPRDISTDIDINVILSEMFDNITHAVSGDPWDRNPVPDDAPIPGQHRLSGPAIEAPVTTVGPAAEEAWRQKAEEMEKQKSEEGRKKRGERRRRGAVAAAEQAGTTANTKIQTDAESLAVSPVPSSSPSPSAPPSTASRGHVETSETKSHAMHPASVIIDLEVRFKDIKAAVPLFSSDLTYRTQTFVRPIVAFMNANHTLIPVHCRVVMDLSEFDGSMDLAQTGLLPVVSDKIYQALANHVTSQRANGQRMRSVSTWWLKLAMDNALQAAVLVRDSLASRLQTASSSESMTLAENRQQ